MTDTISEYAQTRIKLALEATFAGEPVKNFQTDELLNVIGALIQQLDAQGRDLDFRRSVDKPARKHYTRKELRELRERS